MEVGFLLEMEVCLLYNKNKINQLNACRLVYSQCILNNIKIDTFDKVLGDVLRIENYSDYQSFEDVFI